MLKKQVLAVAAIGTMLEVYDFLIYSFLASYIAKVFFAGQSGSLIFIETFIVFSVGYLSRPLGGIFIGSLGDRIGRKKAFSLTLQGMAFATFAIALLPSYKILGILSPIFLMIFRIVQGLCHGAELPGAVTYLLEFSRKEKRGRYAGLVFFGAGLGGILSTSVVYGLTSFFNEHQIVDFAWRIPFFIGGTLSFAGIYFRTQASETPLFSNLDQKNKQPFRSVLKEHFKLVLIGISITLFPAFMIILGHYLPAYLKEFMNFKGQEIYLAMIFGMITFSLSVPFFSYLSDFWGRRKIMLVNNFIVLIIAFSFCFKKELHSLITFTVFYKLFSGIFVACYPAMLAEIFPTNIRYSGVALSYNIAFLIVAILLFFTTTLARKYGDFSVTVWLAILLSVFSIILLLKLRYKDRLS